MVESPHPSPDQLLARFRSEEDADALGALFDAVAPSLYRIALSLLDDANDADDALQRTFLTLLQHADRPDPTRPVVPWLVGVLRIEVLRIRRTLRRTHDPHRSHAEPSDALLDNEDVRRALEALPEPYRAPALLRWRYGLSPAEIAHIRDEAPGTTRSLLSRALAQVRRKLGRVRAAALPAALGLSGVREAVMRRAAAPRGAGASATSWSIQMTTKYAVLSAAVGALVVALILGGIWFAQRSPATQAPAGRESAEAHGREPGPTADMPTLLGRPTEPTTANPEVPSSQATTAKSEKPAETEVKLWTTPVELRGVRDARAMTEAVLKVASEVNELFNSASAIRIVEFDSSGRTNKGTAKAETSSVLDTFTQKIQELKVPMLERLQVEGVDRTTARFTFRTAEPTDDVWEPGEGEDISIETIKAAITLANQRPRSIGRGDVDPRGTSSRTCEVTLANLDGLLPLMQALDDVQGMRVTQVQWRTDESSGAVSATIELTLRQAKPPK